MGSSRRSGALLALAAALLMVPGHARAQRRGRPLVLAGRLVRARGADTLAIGGARVVAHRVGRTRQGPVDSMRTDALGGFRFRVAAPESGAVYVVSTLHDGLGYFSDPITPDSGGAIELVVFDTSSGGPPLALRSRSVVVTRGPGNERRVLDIYQVENPGTTTRVSNGPGPTFSMRLPDGARDLAPGSSDIPASAIRFEPGRAVVSAPFPPGDKQVVVTYSLPGGTPTLTLPVDQPTAEVELMLEDSTAQASAPLQPTDPVAIEGHTFRRYGANDLAAGSSVQVRFSDARGLSRRATLIATVVAALLLVTGATFALARRAPAPAGAGAPAADDLAGESPERLVALLAALDDRFTGREAATPPEAWAAYQVRRSALKAELARRLARD